MYHRKAHERQNLKLWSANHARSYFHQLGSLREPNTQLDEIGESWELSTIPGSWWVPQLTCWWKIKGIQDEKKLLNPQRAMVMFCSLAILLFEEQERCPEVFSCVRVYCAYFGTFIKIQIRIKRLLKFILCVLLGAQRFAMRSVVMWSELVPLSDLKKYVMSAKYVVCLIYQGFTGNALDLDIKRAEFSL